MASSPESHGSAESLGGSQYLLPVVGEGLSDAVIQNVFDDGFDNFVVKGIERLEEENPLLYKAILEFMDGPPTKPFAVRLEILGAVLLALKLLEKQIETEDFQKLFEMSSE